MHCPTAREQWAVDLVWCGVVWCGLVCRWRCYHVVMAGMSCLLE